MRVHGGLARRLAAVEERLQSVAGPCTVCGLRRRTPLIRSGEEGERLDPSPCAGCGRRPFLVVIRYEDEVSHG